jgi:hypothetical protein
MVRSLASRFRDRQPFFTRTGGSDGGRPWGGLIASGGKLFGATWEGGSSNDGTFFSITPEGKCRTFSSFPGLGSFSTPIQYKAAFYGTGGSGGIYSITRKNVYTEIANLNVSTESGLVEMDGIFHGTTLVEGVGQNCSQYGGCGITYSVTPAGLVKGLFAFGGSAGEFPYTAPTNFKGNSTAPRPQAVT